MYSAQNSIIFEPNRGDNRLMKYNWQYTEWPQFHYETGSVDDLLFGFAEKLGHVTAALQALPKEVQQEALINTLVTEAVKTSAIEGEYLSRKDVQSSIRNNLGLNAVDEVVKDKRAAGIGALMIDLRKTYDDPLTEEKLYSWHRMLMAGAPKIRVGAWRSHAEPMQVISGNLVKPTVHFEAPPSVRVPGEMSAFIQWFNDTAPNGPNAIKKAPVRSALVHLYFESIHPFEDGNGRVGRALAEKALAQTVGRPMLLSLSRTIEADKKKYYQALQSAQQTLEVTEWINYFVRVVLQAQEEVLIQVDFTLKKTLFFDRYKHGLNERQLMAIRRMMDEGPGGFTGGMNARKYSGITGTSKATATRDLQDLVEKGVFAPVGGGRSTRYELALLTGMP